jgi:hypothetical protein
MAVRLILSKCIEILSLIYPLIQMHNDDTHSFMLSNISCKKLYLHDLPLLSKL